MRNITFVNSAWEEYLKIERKNKILHKKLCDVLKEMQRSDPAKGIGKPEQLRGNFSGLWSRRLSKGERLIYMFDSETVYIVAIGGHYDDK